MKLIMLAMIMLLGTGCSLMQKSQEVYYEWNVDSSDKAKIDQANQDQKECADFAYRSKIAGSKYTESSIHTSCMNRRGYQMRRVVVGN